jgi:FkbM family methyltransferase
MITIIKKILLKLLHWIDKLTATPINANDKLQAERCAPWFAAKGDDTLRLDYDLNQNSVVFDIGGYKGEFARDISCKYNATIYVFEPIKEFYEIAKKRFINNPKVHVYNFGLGANDTKAYITLEDNGSSLHGKGTNKTEIEIKSFNNFITEHNITTIDLAKLNIEGAEYELLGSIVKAGNATKLKNIQVQFHDFVIDNAKARMNALQTELSKTHTLTYQYEFVWENWKLNN